MQGEIVRSEQTHTQEQDDHNQSRGHDRASSRARLIIGLEAAGLTRIIIVIVDVSIVVCIAGRGILSLESSWQRRNLGGAVRPGLA
jgi:hypothetical protein